MCYDIEKATKAVEDSPLLPIINRLSHRQNSNLFRDFLPKGEIEIVRFDILYVDCWLIDQKLLLLRHRNLRSANIENWKKETES